MKKFGFTLLVLALALMAVPFAAAAHPATSPSQLSPGTSQLAQAGTTPDAGGAGGAGGAGAANTPSGAGTGTGSGTGAAGAGGTGATGAGGSDSTGAGGTGSGGTGSAGGTTTTGNTAGSSDFNWLWLLIPLIILIGLGAYLMSRSRQTTVIENRVERVDRVDNNRP